MKILHIEAGEKMLGGAQQLIYLLAGQSSSKHDHMVLCPKDSQVMSKVSAEGLNVIGTRILGDVDPFFMFRLCKLIRKHKIDLIIVHSRRGADFYGGLAAKLSGIRSILVRRVDNPESRFISKLKYGLYDKIVCISDAIASVLASQGVPVSNLEVIKDCVDTDIFLPKTNQDNDLFDRLNIPKNKLMVGVIAQLISRKGHKFLLQVMPDILAKFPEAHCVFLGAGSSREALEQLSVDLNLTTAVTFTGFRRDIHKIIPQLDIVTHPATMEGMGVALLQSSSAGVPVVAFCAGGIPEVIDHERTGLLVPVGDEVGLKNSLIKLLGSSELRRRYGEQGRQKMLAEFSLTSMRDRYEALYDSLSR
ncbi:glycosyltransferase [Luminiphilus sp.]|nr:glycosyltransferase [Luminiphilus sp.]